MKRWLIATMVAAALIGAAVAADMVTQAKTIAQILIPAGKEARAMFTGLKAEALEMGLGEVVLIGVTEYVDLADTTTRVTIRWHAIGLSNASATQSLTAPLSSQFRTSDKTIPPGTIINVQGDLDALAEDFLKLKERMAKDSPKDTVKQVNNKTTETEKNASELSSTGGGSGSNYGNGSYSTSDDEMSTDMVITTWQDCQPRIDRAGGMVYQQARKIETTESGRLMDTGSCEDHGSTSPIVRTYDGACAPVVDVANRKVYHQYLETATLNDKKIEISACTADFAKFDAIQTSTDSCGYRHDFTAGRSILQEKLFYNDLTGAVVQVRDCGDSSSAYSHYTTKNTCSPTIDSVNKQAFFNVRVAFTDANGAEQYASDCKPDGNPSMPIEEEFCTPKYEHDFVNHVSYYRTRAYYTDTDGNNVYVSECGRSALGSFPHIFETSSCGVRNDDSLKMTYWSKVTQIDSPTDGIVEIMPCQEMGSPTPYAYLGRINGTTTTYAYNVFLPYASLINRIPGVDWSSGLNTYGFGSMSCVSPTPGTKTLTLTTYAGSYSGQAIPYPQTNSDVFGLYETSTRTGTYGETIYSGKTASQSSNTRDRVVDRITMRPYLMRYMRGDATYLDEENGAHYRAEIACILNGTPKWLP